MRTISWKDLLIGFFVAAIMFMLMGTTTATTSDTGGNGRYAVAVGGSSVTYSVCVTDTWTGETRCQQGGGPKKHSFSPIF
jgi:hypothetical protein